MSITALARNFRDKIRAAYHAGGSLECCACGSKVRGFLTEGAQFKVYSEKEVVGSGYRENNVCPACWSTDRERLALTYFKNSPALFERGVRILHVAPEPSIARLFGRHDEVTYLTADYLRPSMSVALDIQTLPFPDNVFDFVICNHVLEHVRDDRLSMRELLRVMKSGAGAMLQVPVAISEADTHEDWSVTTPEARERVFGQNDHVRLYGRDYADRLKESGFQLELLDWREHPGLFGENTDQMGFNTKELLYIGRKP